MKTANISPDAIPATFTERGNGFPDPGDYVASVLGDVYRVLSINGPIQTGNCGNGNWVRGYVEPADWEDLSEGEEATCSCVVDDEEQDESDEPNRNLVRLIGFSR